MHYRGPIIAKANFKKRSKQIIENLLNRFKKGASVNVNLKSSL